MAKRKRTRKSTSASGTSSRVASRFESKSAKRPLLVGLAAIAVLVGVLALIVNFSTRSDSPPRDASSSAARSAAVESLASSSRDEASVFPDNSTIEEGDGFGPLPKDIDAQDQEALQACRQLVEDFPGNPDALLLLGTLHAMIGNMEEATELWQQCLKIAPRHGGAYYQMAKLAERQEEYDKAAELWRELIRINPSLPGIRYQLAVSLVDSGKMQEAINALKQELQISPKHAAESQSLLAKAYLQLRDYEKARESYRAAVTLRPNDSQSWYGLATALARLGKREEAQEAMEEFQNPKVAGGGQPHTYEGNAFSRLVLAHNRAAAMYRAHGHDAKAERHWRRASRVAPRDADCRMQLTKLYLEDGKHDKALLTCKQLVEIDPASHMFHANLGIIHAEMNQIDAALAELRKAIEIAPDSRQYRQKYSELQQRKLSERQN